ncbi:hypothetical protein [Streptomyces hygroscopicus]|uniref:hypothetical protein n=1 Tax=Streptomyces hygroscopicus TaxID=1912 RepID=UPI0036905A77
MSAYRQELRADRAAGAEQRRLDAAAAEQRRAERLRAEDERAARLREQRRADRRAERAEREARRAERAQRRAAALSPGLVYQRGTLALVTASALASLPAQIMHFVGISAMLAPLPLALEGAAWVMAAGVAYADARSLPGWVRWLLRALVAGFAGFAAFINYGYGRSLAEQGLSEADARTVGLGLAAVTLLGPLVFEIRQWVSTLSAAVADDEARGRRRHAARRRRHHRRVVRVAERLISAAPYGDLPAEEAWALAWSVVHGPSVPGMTPSLEKRAVRAHGRLTASRTPARAGLFRRGRAQMPAGSGLAAAEVPEAAGQPSAPCADAVRETPARDAHAPRTPLYAPRRTPLMRGKRSRSHTVRAWYGKSPRKLRTPLAHTTANDVPAQGRETDFDDAVLDRMRQDARRTYAESVQAGQTLSARALGEAYGMSESWARKQINAARARDGSTTTPRLRTVPEAAA